MMKRFALFIFAMIWLATSPVAFSQPSAEDEKVLRQMRFDPKNGVVFMDATIIENGKAGPSRCMSTVVHVKTDTGVSNRVTVLERSSYGGALVLPEGTHAIQGVGCWQGQGLSLNGPFARFNVRAGEFLNLGTLTIVYELDTSIKIFERNSFKADTKVGDLPKRRHRSRSDFRKPTREQKSNI
jgi:hypothetical protein